ncbi:NAD(P)/FAD-dependent oxidoreductase [Microbacterium aquilitoris]|uniref:NAD(P)/FAD-dependent oxidoreductase n=1 Tax=Microbacterium aquilitoris TaxID=3067307 RepID=UPI00288F75C6|nr:NAD(P)/FAD-dependent oxidoreductase [Microbacterium sp. KSW2-22]MDT3345764.1 NAD(P)/FAD-dependent oxidoreductase [Microbacterium sp. KSW2-22]
MTDTLYDAVIVGGGTAGLSAAQMLGRARRRVLVIDAGSPRNRFAAQMHGVLGHDGRSPAELLRIGRAEAEAYGVEFLETTVTSIDDAGDHLTVAHDGGTLAARGAVLTTGVVDDLPDVPGLREQWGRGVIHCPYCHGYEVAGRRLGVLATSPASLHQIELVRQWSDDVTAFTAALGDVDDAAAARLAGRGIRLVDSPVTELRTDDDVVTAALTADGAAHAIDALFTAPTPRLHLDYAASLDLAVSTEPGEGLRVDMRGATSHPRVFAAGNVVSPFGNVPLSMGQGSMAGAGLNAALVMEDAASALRDSETLRS